MVYTDETRRMTRTKTGPTCVRSERAMMDKRRGARRSDAAKIRGGRREHCCRIAGCQPSAWYERPDRLGTVPARSQRKAEVAELRLMLSRTPGLEILEAEDITAGVLAALEADDARKRRMIEDLVPASIRPLFEEFAGVRGGQIHERLSQRTLIYARFVGGRLA